MNFGMIVREAAAVTFVALAAHSVVRTANELADLAQAVVNIATDKLYVDFAAKRALGLFPTNFSEKIKKGFEFATQGAFNESPSDLGTEEVTSLLKCAGGAFALSALAYKVAHNSSLVNTAVSCLSVATRAVASRIV